MIGDKAKQAYAVLKALPVGARAAIDELTRPRRSDATPKPAARSRAKSRAKSRSAKPRRARTTATAKKKRKARGR